MVVIRLARHGAKKRPFYHVVVADSRQARDGRYIERLGHYNPIAKGQEDPLNINLEKVTEWMSKGAQLSDRVHFLVKKLRKSAAAA
jgi:small subunit ribosomal protein S16